MICASKQVHESVAGKARERALALPLGVTVCIVDVVDCVWDEIEEVWEWSLRNPRRVENVPVRGCASFYRVDVTLVRLRRGV